MVPRASNTCNNFVATTAQRCLSRMSYASKISFGLCCMASIGIIGYVHYKQSYDREQLHLGVVRDIERRERRKAENVYVLQQQAELTKELQRGEALRENTIRND